MKILTSKALSLAYLLMTLNAATVKSQQAIEEEAIKIGNQTWTTKNLSVETFQNGDIIPHAKSAEEWENANRNKQPAWCYYNNDPSNGDKFGRLYNWYAINDPRGLAPLGWHTPNWEEWLSLIEYLGGSDIAGSKLKSNNGWIDDGNGSNESGFTGLPGGDRMVSGNFLSLTSNGFWWTTSEANTESEAIYFNLNFEENGISYAGWNKGMGASVRCLKD